MERGRPIKQREPATEFARRLLAWIEQHSLSLEEASKRLQVNVRTLRRWLEEDNTPHPRAIREVEAIWEKESTQH